MLKNMPKRTKVVLSAFILMFLIAAGVGVWGVFTGKLNTKADSFAFPGTGGGTISGLIHPGGNCSIAHDRSAISLVSADGSINVNIPLTRENTGDGSYGFYNVPLGNTYRLTAASSCGTNGEEGYCWVVSNDISSSATVNLQLAPHYGGVKIDLMNLNTGVYIEGDVKIGSNSYHYKPGVQGPQVTAQVGTYTVTGSAPGYKTTTISSYQVVGCSMNQLHISLAPDTQPTPTPTSTSTKTPTPTPTKTPTPTPTCKSNGSSCSTASQCCSGNCGYTMTGKKCKP